MSGSGKRASLPEDTSPFLSVVVPVYNEAEGLPALFARLLPALRQLGRSFELILVNDGSRDESLGLMREACQEHPEMRVVDLTCNVGQYMALMAGMAHVRGEVTVTLDADLQNPPEEIGRLLEKIDEGYDLVGSCRVDRHDSLFRTWISRLVNRVREKLTGLHMRDHGCMLRAYRRSVVDAMNQTEDPTIFINALAQKFAGRATDIEVRHEARHAGQSRYGVFQLVRLFFDLITGFSLVPVQVFTATGFLASFLSLALVVVLLVRRIVVGPEAEGVFTLFALLFLLVSVVMVGIGLVGEYVGRIYLAVARRPRYLVREIIGHGKQK